MKKSKTVWTWLSVSRIAVAVDACEKTVRREIARLADVEGTPNQDSRIKVRLCQRVRSHNAHFQWLVAARENLKFDGEPLFLKINGKSRHLRARCRASDLVSTRTTAQRLLVNQQKRETTHNGLDPWKNEVPSILELFAVLKLAVFPIGNGRYMSHSPWKRESDRTPSCMIVPEDNHFHDFSTGKTGNAVTLARLMSGNPDLPFPDAIRWLKDCVGGIQPSGSSPEPSTPDKVTPVAKGSSRVADFGQNRATPISRLRPKHTPGRNKLAYRIYQEAFAAVEIPGLNMHGVVGMIATALGRGYDKADILQVLLAAIEAWINTPFDIKRRPGVSDSKFLAKRWRNPRLRACTTIDDLTEQLRLGRFLKQLKHDLAVVPSRVLSTPMSPHTDRNADPKAVEMCVTQLHAMFNASDRIWVTTTYAKKGWCRTRDYWVEDIKRHGVPTGDDGAWVKINPMSCWGTGKEHVTAWRHALLESDSLSLDEQLALRGQLPYEVVSATYSGSSSVHYVVKINATKSTYETKMAAALAAFPQFDSQCRDDARWTRLAGGVNKGVLQKLIPDSPADVVVKEVASSAKSATGATTLPNENSPQHWSVGVEHTIALSMRGFMHVFVVVDENTNECLSVGFAMRERDRDEPTPGDVVNELITSTEARYGTPSVVSDQTGLAQTHSSVSTELHDAWSDIADLKLDRTFKHLRQHALGFTLCNHPYEIQNRLELWRREYNRSLTKETCVADGYSGGARVTRNTTANIPRTPRRVPTPKPYMVDLSFAPPAQNPAGADEDDPWSLPGW